MKKDYFSFQTFLSEEEFNTLSQLIREENPYYNNKGLRDWFFNQVNHFCREVAQPLLEQEEKKQQPKKRQKRKLHVRIQNSFFDDMQTTSLEILNKYAAWKQISRSDIISSIILRGTLSHVDEIKATKIRIRNEK